MQPRQIALALAVAGFACLAPARADATTVSYSFLMSPTTTDFTADAMVHKFNTSLGTLESVTISYNTVVSSSIVVKNTVATTGTVNAKVVLTLTDSGDNLSLVNTANTNTKAFSITANNQTATVTPSGQKTASQLYNTQTILEEFTGSGKIDLSISTVTTYSLTTTSGSPSIVQDQTSSKAFVNGSVTYTYAGPPPVPEPSSLVLGALGAVGILATGLKRRGHSAAA